MKLVRLCGCSKRRQKPFVLTPPQVAKYLEPLATLKLKTMVSVALALGARASEIAGLRWCDIDDQARNLRVKRSVVARE